LIALRVEIAVEALEVEGPSTAIEEAEDAVGFADPAGLDRGLTPLERPGVAEAAPLSKARRVAEANDRVLVAGAAQDVRPGLLEPEQCGRVVEVVGSELPLLLGEAPAIQQVTDVAWGMGDLEAPLDQVGNHPRRPAGTGVASHFGTVDEALAQLRALGAGQVRGTATARPIDHSGHPAQDEGVQPIPHRLLPDPEKLRHRPHRLPVGHSHQRVNPSNQTGRVRAVRLLQSRGEGLARLATQCDSHHDGILSRSEWVFHRTMGPQDAVNRQVTEATGILHDDLSECL
jgi:hypothetical protein